MRRLSNDSWSWSYSGSTENTCLSERPVGIPQTNVSHCLYWERWTRCSDSSRHRAARGTTRRRGFDTRCRRRVSSSRSHTNAPWPNWTRYGCAGKIGRSRIGSDSGASHGSDTAWSCWDEGRAACCRDGRTPVVITKHTHVIYYYYAAFLSRHFCH